MRTVEQQRTYNAAYGKTPRGRTNRTLASARHRAKKLGLDFDLDTEWFLRRLETGHCEITGLPFDLSKDPSRRPFWPSIDRKDNAMGYLKSNCRLVVTVYNMAKLEGTDEDVLVFARAVLNGASGLYDH